MTIAHHPVAVATAAETYKEPLAALWRTVAADPTDVSALCELGNLLVRAKRPLDAVGVLGHAVKRMPDESRLLSNLGIAWCDMGAFEQAADCFQKAIAQDPEVASHHHNLGRLLVLEGMPAEAILCFDRALTLQPNYPKARTARAQALLACGRFSEGWASLAAADEDAIGQIWQGQSFIGQRMLLTAQQGLGDTVQFVRYAALAKQRGGTVVLYCPEPLCDLLRNVEGVDEIVATSRPMPPHDIRCPLLALPHLFNTTLDTIPAPIPYIHPAADAVAHWHAWRHSLGVRGLVVGLYWQGNPHHEWDLFRSCPLEAFRPLMDIPDVTWVSLQRGPGCEQIAAFQSQISNRLAVPLRGKEGSADNIVNFAGLLSVIDLVITVDTFTAHLAGALGQRVWTLLSTATDWRWMTHRSDTPWYPTMWLFRQSAVDHWDILMRQVSENLNQWSAAHQTRNS